ncbi:ABC transporter ATP-binding protein [Haloarchaeobius iranensis]|uniref:ABC-2 type transport system ATP-binding protein n=2 Tax=Haloarchaeobius iranensis TaxID=996166 RepID=A0A1G9WJP1_9EURY|nr:ABC transporter ATP-binding protein [Haloarchaeobius iranensis]SDM84802.1 ABC-2 type transport system ATP-binding protein [Haloarchaeobius iranensis]
MTVLATDGVRKTYGETTALDGVSLSVEAGEVFALIGPNGAGKTTLVRSLTGTVDPDGGTVELLGTAPREADEDRLGVLPQSFSPPGRLTAREVVAYYAGLYEDARDVDAVLAEVGVSDAADTWYENCSGGQQRRVCLGATLVNDPDVLFLDEPTTGIDPAGRRTLWDRIEALAAGGTTVFLTTHDMNEAERLADRVGLLADGDLVAVGSPGELVREHGGDRRLTVTVDGDPTAAADALGREAMTDGDRVVARGVEPAAIGDIVDALDRAGVEYTELSWAEPSLEDVYLALAGERFEPRAGRPVAGDD